MNSFDLDAQCRASVRRRAVTEVHTEPDISPASASWIGTGLIVAIALMGAIFIWVLEGERIAERLSNHLYQEERV